MKEYDATEQAFWNGYRKAVETFEKSLEKSQKTEAKPIEKSEAEIMKALEWCEMFTDNIVLSNKKGEKFTFALQSLQTIKQVLKDYNRKNAEIESLKKCLEAACNGIDKIAKELGVEL